jgi:hypothetical protein
VKGAPGPQRMLEVGPRGGQELAPELRTGDPELDRGLLVTGRSPYVVPALNLAARQSLLTLLDPVRLSPFQSILPNLSSLSLEEIMRHCPGLLELARSFSWQRTPDDLRDALIENTRHDPSSGVRVRNLETLLESFESDAKVLELSVEALKDSDPHIRLLAASHAPTGTEPAMLHAALLELAAGEHAPPIRVKALEVLGRRPEEIPDHRRHLLGLLQGDSEQVRTAAFAQLTARGWQPEQGTLALAPGYGGELSLTGDTTALHLEEERLKRP